MTIETSGIQTRGKIVALGGTELLHGDVGLKDDMTSTLPLSCDSCL